MEHGEQTPGQGDCKTMTKYCNRSVKDVGICEDFPPFARGITHFKLWTANDLWHFQALPDLKCWTSYPSEKKAREAMTEMVFPEQRFRIGAHTPCEKWSQNE